MLLVTSSVLGFLHVSFHRRSFHRVGLLLCLASASQGMSRCYFSQVKSEKRHRRCWGSLSFPRLALLQQKFEAMDRPVLQLSFVWQAKKNTSSRPERGPTQRCQEKSETQFWLLFLYVFFSSCLSLPYINWASEERRASSEGLTAVFGPSFVLFSWAFSFFVF